MISFHGMGEQMITFAADGVTEGFPVVMAENDTVTDAEEGAALIGVAVHVEEDGFAAVQMQGFMQLPYSGTAPALGWQNLSADGAGGLKVTDGEGKCCLVVSVDNEAGSVGLFL